MEVLPRNDYILVLPDNAEKMRGKLYLPASANQVITRGTVQAVGPGYLLNDGSRQMPDLEIGDRVEYIAHPGQPVIDIDGQLHLMMKEVEIIAKIAGEPIPMILPEGDEDDETEAGPPLLATGTSASAEADLSIS